MKNRQQLIKSRGGGKRKGKIIGDSENVMGVFNPEKAILPIFLVERCEEGISNILKLLGTGFFVGEEPLIVTADHVLNRGLEETEDIGCLWFNKERELEFLIVEEEEFINSEKYDIAVFSAASIPKEFVTTLALREKKIDCTEEVLTYEFSSTSISRESDNIKVNIPPYTHMGNILRYYKDNLWFREPTPAFETSFPAIMGASGAPVLHGGDLSVVGMIVGNSEKEKNPSSTLNIRKTTDSEGDKEICYVQMTGIAIESCLIIDFLESHNGSPEII